LIVTIVGIVLMPFLKYLINLPENIPNIYLYYILLLSNTVMSYLFVYQTTLIVADQKQYIINKYDIVFQYILFIVQLIILMLTKNFALYLLSNVLCTFICNLLKVRKTKQYYPYLKDNKSLSLPKSERKKIFGNLSSLFFYKIGSVIQSNTDNILISIFVGTIVVGYYSNYNTIIISIAAFITMIFTSIKASLGNFIVQKERENQLKMFNILETINFWLVGFCSICFINLIPDFILICFGKEYVLDFSLLIFVVLNFYTSNIRQTLWAYRETTGLFKKTKYITIVTSSLNLILSIIFGKIYGLTGIIGATVLSRMIYAWWREPLILFRSYFNTSPKVYFYNYLTRLCIVFIISFLTLYISNFINFNNLYLSFICKMIFSSFVTIISFVIIYRNSETMRFIEAKILKKRGKDNG